MNRAVRPLPPSIPIWAIGCALLASIASTACGSSEPDCDPSSASCSDETPGETCTTGDSRCDGGGNIETCHEGSWLPSSSCPGNLCQSGQCAFDHELEPADQKGENDAFVTAQPIPFAVDFAAHIGQLGDVDTFNFEVDRPGTVTVSLEFTDSWQAATLHQFMAITRTDDFPQSALAVGLSNPAVDECRDFGSAVVCRSHLETTSSVTPVQGVYTLVVKGTGLPDQGVPGFDSEHPYILRVDFSPGPTLESDQPPVDGRSMGEADVWRTAEPISFDSQTGVAELATYGYYWYDVDWYTFEAPVDGTLQLTADVDAAEDGDPRKIALWEQGNLFAQRGAVLEPAGLDFIVSDSPNCSVNHEEFREITAGTTYYLRLFSFESSTTTPYRVHLKLIPGGPEDDQPGPVGATDTPATAADLGTITPGTPTVASSYFWPHGDYDWYKVHGPAGNGGRLAATLDYTATYDALGWRPLECSANPYGIIVSAYLFDQAWFEGSQDFGDHLTRATAEDVPMQVLEYNVAANSDDRDFYILIRSRENWDQQHPYQLTVAYTAN